MSSPSVWYEKEEQFLKKLQSHCVTLSKQYMELYKIMHSKQTRLRLPAIFLSSFSGVASFGSTSFPVSMQKWVSIGVGIVNIFIAMLQTYESYLKLGDIVSKSLTVSTSLKKLADEINCELYIPVQNRDQDGIDYLKDRFTQYQTMIANAPPLEVDENEASDTFKKLMAESDGIPLSPSSQGSYEQPFRSDNIIAQAVLKTNKIQFIHDEETTLAIPEQDDRK
jgi:hypothetical protein